MKERPKFKKGDTVLYTTKTGISFSWIAKVIENEDEIGVFTIETIFDDDPREDLRWQPGDLTRCYANAEDSDADGGYFVKMANYNKYWAQLNE